MTSLLKQWLMERGGAESEPLFVTRAGNPLSRDTIEHRLAKYVDIAGKALPAITQKKITMHALRHSAAMRLMRAGIERTFIVLWLGHEQVGTIDIYLHADTEIKKRALAKIVPASVATRRFKPDDTLLGFLEAL